MLGRIGCVEANDLRDAFSQEIPRACALGMRPRARARRRTRDPLRR